MTTVRHRRVVVAWDASSEGGAAADAAVRLAERWNAELRGLFVQEECLLQLGGLSVARESSLVGADCGKLDDRRLSLLLDVTAERARRQLESRARRAGIPASFSVQRGGCVNTLLEAAQNADLLAIGHLADPLSARRRIGPALRRLLIESEASVLFQEGPIPQRLPIRLVCAAEAAASAGLGAATDWAHLRSPSIELWWIGSEPPDPETKARLARQAAELRLPALMLRTVSVDRLLAGEMLVAPTAGLTILSRADALPVDRWIAALELLHGAVLMLRSTHSSS